MVDYGYISISENYAVMVFFILMLAIPGIAFLILEATKLFKDGKEMASFPLLTSVSLLVTMLTFSQINMGEINPVIHRLILSLWILLLGLGYGLTGGIGRLVTKLAHLPQLSIVSRINTALELTCVVGLFQLFTGLILFLSVVDP